MPIPSVTLIETRDGSHSLESATYGVSYHSRYGAMQESQHVFIGAGLQPLISYGAPLRVLELGLGTGLNALLSMREAQRWKVPLFYQAVELNPLGPAQVAALNYPDLLDLHERQRADFRQLHECPAGTVATINEYFSFQRLEADFATAPLAQHMDLVYYDAFAPTAQPELWELSILARAYEALAPGGVLVTYCAKGAVKRNLKALGFTLESLPGPPGKREMTRARKAAMTHESNQSASEVDSRG